MDASPRGPIPRTLVLSAPPFASLSLPIPWMGASLRCLPNDDLGLDLSARGFRVEGWDTLGIETGTVHLNQRDVDAAGRSGSSDPWRDVRYRHPAQTETSHEEGGDVAFSGVGPELAVIGRFGSESRSVGGVLGTIAESRADSAQGGTPCW